MMLPNAAIASQYKKFLQQQDAKAIQAVTACDLHDVIRSIDCFMESVRQVLNVPFSKIQNNPGIIPTVDRDAVFGKIKEMLKLANTFDSDINEIINFYDPTYLEFVLSLVEKTEEVKEMSEIFGYNIHKHRRRRADLVATFLPYKGTRAIAKPKSQPTAEEVNDFLQTVDYVCTLIDQKLARVPSFPDIDILIGESNSFITRARVYRGANAILVSYYNDELLPSNAVSKSFCLKDELMKNKHSILLNDRGALDRCLDQLCRTALGFDVQTLRNLMSDCPSILTAQVSDISQQFVQDLIHKQGDFYPAYTKDDRKSFLQRKANQIPFGQGVVTNSYFDGNWRLTSIVQDNIRNYGFSFNTGAPVVIDEKFISYDTLEVTISQDIFEFGSSVLFSIKLKISECDLATSCEIKIVEETNDECQRKIRSLKDALAFAMTIRLMPLYIEALAIDGYLLDGTVFYPRQIIDKSNQAIKRINQGSL